MLIIKSSQSHEIDCFLIDLKVYGWELEALPLITADATQDAILYQRRSGRPVQRSFTVLPYVQASKETRWFGWI